MRTVALFEARFKGAPPGLLTAHLPGISLRSQVGQSWPTLWPASLGWQHVADSQRAECGKKQTYMTHPLYNLLVDLDAANVHFVLSRHRPDSVLVSMTFVGERVEVDVFDDGHMEVSRFKGSEDVVGGAALVPQIIAELR
jgi:hypothetical protein